MNDPGIAETLTDALSRPAEIRSLHLHFDDSPIIAIDPRVAWLASLREIHIGTNRSDIQRLDGLEALARLGDLREIGLSLDGLAAFPDTLFALTAIERLSLRGSGIRTLPSSLGAFRELKRLELSLWNLESLPSSIGRLTKLEHLSLRGCRLGRLPDEIGDLASLQDLFAERNQLEELPASIARLTSLKRLLVGSNRLRALPESLATLASLEWIDAASNTALAIVPAALAGKSGLRLEVEPEKLPPRARRATLAASSDAMRELDARARARERPVSTFVIVPGEGGPTDSKIGGTPWLAHDETWPECGICEAPLTFWLQLDLGAPPGRAEHVLVQLFCCEREPPLGRLQALVAANDPRIAQWHQDALRELFDKVPLADLERIARDARSDASWSPVHTKFFESRAVEPSGASFQLRAGCRMFAAYVCGVDRLVRVVDALAGVVPLNAHAQARRAGSEGGPTPRRIVRFARHVDRPSSHDLGPDAWTLVEKLTREEKLKVRNWTLATDKLGGWPRWLQDAGWHDCPECGEPTSELVLALEGSDEDLFPEIGSSILYVTRCPKHPRRLVWSTQDG